VQASSCISNTAYRTMSRNGKTKKCGHFEAALSRYKREQHGHENKLQTVDTPTVNKRPFNTIKLHFIKETDQVGIAFSITINDIVSLLLSQLGLQTKTSSIVVIKLQRVDAWATSAAGDALRPAVTADISSLVPQLGDPATPGNAIVHYPVLKKLTDTGSVSRPARVSYTWPLSQREIPLSKNSNFTVVTFASNVKETDVYFHVHWSTADVSPPVPDDMVLVS